MLVVSTFSPIHAAIQHEIGRHLTSCRVNRLCKQLRPKFTPKNLSFVAGQKALSCC